MPSRPPDAASLSVLDALTYRDGDNVTDLFPGSGAVASALAQEVLAV